MSIQESVTIKLKKGFLTGTLYTPNNTTAPWRTVMFCHGFTGNRIEARRIFANFARIVCDSGFTVLTFDYRGHGESSGQFEEFTLNDWIDDAQSAFNHLMKIGFVNPENITVLGFSMGGCIASYLAAKNSNIGKVVLWAPLSNPLVLAENKINKLPDEVKANFEKTGYYDKGGLKITAGFMKALEDIDPVKKIAASEVQKVLIIHAEDDQVLDISQHGLVYKKALQKSGRMVFFENIPVGGHVFSNVESEKKLFQTSLDFICDNDNLLIARSHQYVL